MNQYCRYCNNLVTGNGTYCEAKEKAIRDTTAIVINHCKEFEFNPIDAYGTGKRYKPRNKEYDSNQIGLFDEKNGIYR